MSYKKYYVYKKQYTTDGVTWADVTPVEWTPSGDPIGTYDTFEQCGENPPQYRTLSGTPYCNGTNKYIDTFTEISFDNGSTWEPASATSATVLLESTSMDCTKLWTSYSDGNTYATPCDSNTYISRDTTRPEGYYFMRMTHAKVGNCVTEIYTSAFGETPSGGSYEGYSACTALTDCVLGNSITRIGQRAFYKCSSLTGITIPNTIENIENYAFQDCFGLQSVTILATTPPSLGTNVFVNSVSTATYPIYVPCESLSTYRAAWSGYASRIEGIPPCEETNMKFKANYNGGRTLTIECNGNNTLTSGETKPSGYNYSTGMTSAEIGDCVTNIGGETFALCFNLSRLNSNVDGVFNIPSGVTSIGVGTFKVCSSLTSVTIPDSVTSIDGYAFSGCTNLSSVIIPDSVTSIGVYGFNNCSSLTSCTIGSGVTSIGAGTFKVCSSLTNIEIPDGVESINSELFRNCSSLTSCTIGSGVTSIGSSAFTYCNNVENLTCKATTPPTLASRVFWQSTISRIYVPSGSVNAYKAASGWSDYASRIQAIP